MITVFLCFLGVPNHPGMGFGNGFVPNHPGARSGDCPYRVESFSSIFRQDAPIPNPDGDSRLAHLLGDCLAQLEATDRAILEGKYLQGATVVELASTHNLSIKSVESRLARLRKEVREKVFAKLRQP